MNIKLFTYFIFFFFITAFQINSLELSFSQDDKLCKNEHNTIDSYCFEHCGVNLSDKNITTFFYSLLNTLKTNFFLVKKEFFFSIFIEPRFNSPPFLKFN